MSDGLALYDHVRIIWRDSFHAEKSNWAAPEVVEAALDEGAAIQETGGLWFGVHAGCACIVQSRGVSEGDNEVDSALAIPAEAVLLIERLG